MSRSKPIGVERIEDGEIPRRFNEQRVGPAEFRALVLLLKHPETGEIIGRPWGGTAFRQFHVDMLVVREALRGSGLGRQMMQQAEEEAQRHGGVGLGSTRSRSSRAASTSAWATRRWARSTNFRPGTAASS